MALKRVFDIFASLTGLIILSPSFLLIIFAIKASMSGNVFFRQIRVGKGGVTFKLLKFRTMENLPDASEGRFDPGDRSRVTRLGSVLRKYKLDELPQLVNVLIGNMSLVGPRPEIKKWTEFYPEKWEVALKVRPGITDNASIEFRDEEELLADSDNPEVTYRNEILPRKLDLYVKYVNSHTFFGDALIIIKTLIKIITK